MGGMVYFGWNGLIWLGWCNMDGIVGFGWNGKFWFNGVIWVE